MIGLLWVAVVSAMLAVVLFGWVSLLYPMISVRARRALVRIGSVCTLCYVLVLLVILFNETSRVVAVFSP